MSRPPVQPTLWYTLPAGAQDLLAADPSGLGRPAVVIRAQGAGNLVVINPDGALISFAMGVGQEIQGAFTATDATSAIAIAVGY